MSATRLVLDVDGVPVDARESHRAALADLHDVEAVAEEIWR